MAIRIDAGRATLASGAPLRTGDVHIWCALLDRPACERAEFEETLSPDEKVRAQRYRRGEDRGRFVVRRGVLRALLGEYVGCVPRDVRMTVHAGGKPALDESAGHPAIAFSASHSMGLGVFAFSREPLLGVDVERVRDMSERDDIVAGAFSERERAFFSGLAPDERTVAFFRIWTRKEACAKAIGTGLTIALNAIQVPLAERDAAARVGALHIRSFVPAPGFIAALATSHAVARVTQMSWESREGGG